MDRMPRWHYFLVKISLILFLILCILILNVDSAIIPEKDTKIGFRSTLSSDERNTEYGFEELANINFLTKVRRKRDVIENDYHILKIDLPQSNTSLKIHLAKNDHSASPEVLVHNGKSTTRMSGEDLNTHLYMGTTTMESNGTSINGNEYGTAAISLNSKNNGKRIEFSGLLIFGADHFVLEPTEEASNENSTSQISPHLIIRMAQNSATRKHDVMRVPKEELLKAIEEMKSREIGESEISTSDETSEEADDDFDEENFIMDQSLLFQQPTSMSMASEQKKKKKPVTGSDKLIIEIAVFTDAALFRKLKMKTSKETVQRIRNMALTVVNNMNLLYKQPSMSLDLSFRLVFLEIMTSNPKKMKTHDGKGTKYLTSFCKYAGDKNPKGELWDHALMLTGLNIKEDGDDSTAGLAWMGTMCLQYWSCSLSEGYSFGSVFVVAHEIGHSLGMEHDGSGPSFTCNPERYLMSATTGVGKVTWSTCSISNVKEFIKTGNPEVGKKDPKSRPSCLTKNSPRRSKALKYSDGRLPGQIYRPTQQCKLECGETCKPYKKNVCGMLFCEGTTKSKKTFVREAHPALEGTECDKGKRCRAGKCVAVG